jgi:hypothetical protein
MVENVSLSFTSFIRREIGHQDRGPYRVCFVYGPVTAKLSVRPLPFPYVDPPFNERLPQPRVVVVDPAEGSSENDMTGLGHWLHQ